jgi:hypothetical protein
MTEYRSILERAGLNAPPADLSLERILHRRDRKRRNRRITAGVVGIAVFVLPTIGVLRLLGSERGPVIGPGTSQPTTSPALITERFHSPVHGLSIGYPSGWQTRAATEPWGHDELGFGAHDVDVIFDPAFRQDLYLAVVSEPLGETPGSAWGNDLWTDLESVGICARGFGTGSGSGESFHGNDAWWNERCGTPAGIDNVMIVATATRGYLIYLHVADEPRIRTTYDWDWFEATVETVDLHPEDAIDPLDPSPSP